MTEQDSIFPLIEPYLSQVDKPVRYINHEWGSSYNKDASFLFCMVYPDVYEIGQVNRAVSILCDCARELDDVSAERSYLPWVDMASLLREKDIPLFALESGRAIKDFDLVGITLPHELAATNVLEFLNLAQIPLHAKDRNDNDPLIIGGGPCAYNPEPYYEFFDAFAVGDGEDLIKEKIETLKKCKQNNLSRADKLKALSQIEGIYVPAFYEQKGNGEIRPLYDFVPARITRRVYNDFSSSKTNKHPIVPYMNIVQNRVSEEISRGCARGCRFCQAGYIYRPIRERAALDICDTVLSALQNTGFEELSLTSLSATDHSQIVTILNTLNAKLEGTGTKISLPSTRADSFAVEMASLISKGKKGGLTLAPEAGTQRMRDVINKNVTEENIFTAIRAAFEAGWTHVKLYFMMGLPFETDQDILGISELVAKCIKVAKEAAPAHLRGSIRIDASCAMFIPKTHTPFQWAPQISFEELERRQNLLKDSFPKKNARLSWHDAATSLVEAYLARAGREGAQVIERAWRNGARFDAWTEHFSLDYWVEAAEACNTNLSSVACKSFAYDDILPWDHIDCGVSKSYFQKEALKAELATLTHDCTFESCTGCGLCTSLNTSNTLQAPRDNRRSQLLD